MEYKYEGDYNDEHIRHGDGKAFYLNGDVYEGQYSNGRRHGHGIYRFMNGAVFDGEWVDGKKNGFGKFTYPDGSRYEVSVGAPRQGIAGVTKEITQRKLTQQVCQDLPSHPHIEMSGWHDDLRHGFGTYFYLNRDVYSGEWVEHIRHGPGKYTYASNGVVYTGNWERGKRAGSGAVSVLSREALTKILQQGHCQVKTGVHSSEFLLNGSLETFVLPEGGRDKKAKMAFRADASASSGEHEGSGRYPGAEGKTELYGRQTWWKVGGGRVVIGNYPGAECLTEIAGRLAWWGFGGAVARAAEAARKASAREIVERRPSLADGGRDWKADIPFFSYSSEAVHQEAHHVAHPVTESRVETHHQGHADEPQKSH